MCCFCNFLGTLYIVLCWMFSFCPTRFTLYPSPPCSLSWKVELNEHINRVPALLPLVEFGPWRAVARKHSEGRVQLVYLFPRLLLGGHLVFAVISTLSTCKSLLLSKHVILHDSPVWSRKPLSSLRIPLGLAAGSPGFLLYPVSG